MELTHVDIKKAITKGQHCQRNWDLYKDIPEEDMDLLIHSVTQCPSKQNTAFYSVYAITDRNVIENIHKNTSGFYLIDQDKTVTNSQTLANILFVFTDNTQNSAQLEMRKKVAGDSDRAALRDLHMATGIASGFLNLTANILGYSTGCCACFDGTEIKQILNTDDDIVLMMGVGHKNNKINRRIHHADENVVFPTHKKEEIKVYKI
jgi:nitroreductase